jgi:hypothetical protein
MVDGHQQTIERLTWWYAVVIVEFSYVGEKLIRDLAELHVGLLRSPLEYLERVIWLDAVYQHEDAADVVDGFAARVDLGDSVSYRGSLCGVQNLVNAAVGNGWLRKYGAVVPVGYRGLHWETPPSQVV